MSGEHWQIRVLFDGECPLCKREIAFLRRLDDGRQQIDFEDIASPAFDASRYGLDQASVEARIHGILPDGRVVEGVDVFARAYSAVGFTWIATLSEWRGVRWLMDRLYLFFAKNRLRLTGRAPRQCTDVSPPAFAGIESHDPPIRSRRGPTNDPFPAD